MKILIQREVKDKNKETKGTLFIIKNDKVIYCCKTIELPWKNNETYVSCIPSGEYNGYKHISPHLGKSIWIKNVPNRSEILIHKANYVYELKGCVAVGEYFIDFNGDNILDVSKSKKTIEKIYDIIDDEIKIQIEYI